MHKSTQRKRSQGSAGFTLIEVLVVVGIAAVLAGLALTSVRDVIQRARAADRLDDIRHSSRDRVKPIHVAEDPARPSLPILPERPRGTEAAPTSPFMECEGLY